MVSIKTSFYNGCPIATFDYPMVFFFIWEFAEMIDADVIKTISNMIKMTIYAKASLQLWVSHFWATATHLTSSRHHRLSMRLVMWVVCKMMSVTVYRTYLGVLKTPFIIFSENPISLGHRHIHTRSHGPSCRCPYTSMQHSCTPFSAHTSFKFDHRCTSTSYVVLKMILVVNPPKTGESIIFI